MLTVVIESPYAAGTAAGVARNLRYLRACMAFCLAQDVAPYASHGLYTQPGVLNDQLPEERKKGMRAGFAIGAQLDQRWFFTDLGMTDGMLRGEEAAKKKNQVTHRFQIPDWETFTKRDAFIDQVFCGLVFRHTLDGAPAPDVVARWHEEELLEVFRWLRLPDDFTGKVPGVVVTWMRTQVPAVT